MFKKQKIKSKSGITLVALVVTIVVLLILAGVSLNLVIGNDGIIRRAKEAQERYRQASENEQKDLELAADCIDEMISGIEKINGVPIPNGYYYVGGTKNTGLVISDESSDENKYKTAEDGKVLKDDLVGNQWVWVPVEEISKYCESVDSGESMSGSVGVTTKLYTKTATIGRTGDTATIKRVKPGNTSSYREPDLLAVGSNDTSFDAENYRKIVGENGTLKEMAELFKREYETMIKSIEKYGGFYIGRYELSNEGVQKEKATLTNKNWYELYKKCTTLNASDKVESKMIWGIQWDLACDFISKKGEQKSITNSTTWGNYPDSTGNAAVMDGETKKYGSKQVTGYSEYWKANNIYDLAGNCYEWTQDANNTNNRASRGDDCNYNGPASSRDVSNAIIYNNAVNKYRNVRFSPHSNNKVALEFINLNV